MRTPRLSRTLIATALATAAAQAGALDILLCNDDGFTTANTRALYQRLEEAGHRVVVSAPADNQSGRGGFVTFLQPIPAIPESYVDMYTMRSVVPRIVRVYPELAGAPGVGNDPHDNDISYVWGSPVMACLFGIDVKAPRRFGRMPDLVISGPNEGSNTGHINVSSGTVNSAYYAINRRLAAIAVSDSVSTQLDYTALTPQSRAWEVADIVVRLVDTLAANAADTGTRLLPRGAGLNVNIPNFPAGSGETLPFALTSMGRATAYAPAFYKELSNSAIGGLLGLEGPGISVVAPDTRLPSGSVVPADNARNSEGNRIAAGGAVTLTVMEGVPEAEQEVVDRVRGGLAGLLE